MTVRTRKCLNPLFVVLEVHGNHVMHEIPGLLNCRYNTELYFGFWFLFFFSFLIRPVKSKYEMTDLCVFGDNSFFGGCY